MKLQNLLNDSTLTKRQQNISYLGLERDYNVKPISC